MSALSTAGVIAAYNHERFIAEAVSRLAPQVDELFVINDASSDQTRQVLDSLSFPNLRVLHNPEQLGVSGSYNRAVALASADLLVIQGGDDVSLAGRSEAQANILRDDSVSLVCSLPRVIDDQGRHLPDSAAGEFQAANDEGDVLSRLYFGSNFICAPTVALRRKDYLRCGGFPVGLDLLQDYALWLELAAVGEFVVMEEPATEYRKHASNLSREYNGIDSPKKRRYAAEMEFIRDRFISRAPEDLLERLARHVSLDLDWFAGLDLDEKKGIIRLSHRDKLVLRRGLSHLFEIAGSPNGQERLRKLGLSLRDLSELSLRADHDNLAGVSSALAVVRAIDRITPPPS
jgi:glycosyltransferase involved in cell wall biosynthesis